MLPSKMILLLNKIHKYGYNVVTQCINGVLWYGRVCVKDYNGVLILMYKSATSHLTYDGSLHIKFSNDYGVTWSDEDKYLNGNSISGFPMNPPNITNQDAVEPWLIVAPNGDLLLHMWKANSSTGNGSFQSRSTDGGLSWDTPTSIDFLGISGDTAIYSTDDDFIYDDIIYAAARKYENSKAKCIFIKSTDNGVTWQYVSDMSSSTLTPSEEVGIEYLGSGTIIAIYRGYLHDKTYQSISTDMGLTWVLVDITSSFHPVGRPRVYTSKHLRGEPNWWNDNILFCCGFEFMNPPDWKSRRNAIWYSTNTGTTWNGPYYMDLQYEDGGYGSMVYNPNTQEYVYISYAGAVAGSSIVQYNFKLEDLIL